MAQNYVLEKDITGALITALHLQLLKQQYENSQLPSMNILPIQCQHKASSVLDSISPRLEFKVAGRVRTFSTLTCRRPRIAPRPTGAPFPFQPLSQAPPEKQNVLHEGSYKQKQHLPDPLHQADCTAISLLITFIPLAHTPVRASTTKRIKPSPIHSESQLTPLS